MKKTDILVPQLPESITDATVVKWHKKIGDKVLYNENLVDIETDKVMLEVSSPCEGILHVILEKEDNIVTSQQILGHIHTHKKNQKNTIKDMVKDVNLLYEKKNMDKKYSEEVLSLSPSIRRLKHNYQKDDSLSSLNKINGLRHNQNMITIEQNTVKNVLKKPHDTISTTKDATPSTHRVKMTHLRQKISERLLYTKKNTAMLTTFNEVNMQNVLHIRNKYGDLFKKKHGVKMGLMSFYVKAVIESLKKFPEINAFIDNKDIVYHNNFDINIAISTPRGLIAPVLKNADTMSMSTIEQKIKELSMKGYHNKITIQELMSGNFTITNGGIFGSLMSTPIINPPQSAILGMHLIQDRPMAVDGKIVILPMMYLALSYDHCLIDGKQSVGFLLSVKKIIEDFTRILIDV